jgi:hypothetical protein
MVIVTAAAALAVNRIGGRTITRMLLMAAPALVLNLLGHQSSEREAAN